ARGSGRAPARRRATWSVPEVRSTKEEVRRKATALPPGPRTPHLGALLRAFGLGGLLGLAALLALVPVVLALALLHPAGGVDELHLAGEERVAGRADLDRDVLARAAGDELVAAAARHGRLFVLGVNAFLHRVRLRWRWFLVSIAQF